MHATHHVFYNDGQSEDNFAIVLNDNGGGSLDLHVLEGSEKGSSLRDVPRREKKDYDAAGGGRTWHL